MRPEIELMNDGTVPTIKGKVATVKTFDASHKNIIDV